MCVGVLIGVAAPGLAPGGRPHPTLHGTLGDFASIAIANARVLSAPFLLALFRFPSDRRSRQLGNLLVVVLLGGNALRVGLALGRDRGALLPYLPQLPLEWLAAALAAAAWLTLRTGPRERTGLGYVAAILVLVAAAAAIETICTPHTAAREHTLQAEGSTGALHAPGPISVRKARGGLSAPDGAPAPALASRSLASNSIAIRWLVLQQDVGRSPRTVEAYARSLVDYLGWCDRAGVDALAAGRAEIAGYLRDLRERASRYGANVVALSSGAGLANAT